MSMTHANATDRRSFIKTGFAALSSLAVGETILLMPSEAEAFFGIKSLS